MDWMLKRSHQSVDVYIAVFQDLTLFAFYQFIFFLPVSKNPAIIYFTEMAVSTSTMHLTCLRNIVQSSLNYLAIHESSVQ